MNDKNNQPPEQIYLQCYESNGTLIVSNDVTWCVDQINDNDAVYILSPNQPPRTKPDDDLA